MIGDLMVTIIGGGASGLIAAITAGRVLGGGNVKICEKNDRVGRKILATGNGRCNLTNINASEGDYIGGQPGFVSHALRIFGPEQTIQFFERLGLCVRAEDDGRVYPKCSLSGAVLDTLRNEVSRLNIEVIHANVIKVAAAGPSFSIYTSEGKRIETHRAIVATGGCAAPFLGSDGGGYGILTDMGHKLNDVYPALVQIRTSRADMKPLNGIRVCAGVSLMDKDRLIAYEEGEIQFTNYGVSGIPALNLSCKAGQGNSLIIDFSPDTDRETLTRLLERRASDLPHLAAGQFFTGFFHKSVGRLLLKSAGVSETFPVSRFTVKEITKLANSIKSFYAPISGTLGFNDAQVTGGGVRTDGFNPRTMESLIKSGLYAAGEVLDIYGPCGGYNLQWAWSSGCLAGMSAALSSQ